MNPVLLRGEQGRLAALNLETDVETMAGWTRDSEFSHLLETGAPEMWTAQVAKVQLADEQDDEKSKGKRFSFVIRTLADDRLIGFVDLEVNHWSQREGWLGIGIGRREDWGKGYGTDAMRVLARYSFAELSLERLSLTVFAYNERAVRSYLKAGFSVEGRQRERLRRGARRYDMIFMGILREEWLAQQPPASA